MRLVRTAVLAVLALAATAAPALAHGGDPRYRSVVDGVQPALPGIKVQTLGYDNELQLVNTTDRPVTIYGYNGEPYARVLGDGTVQVNQNSPATYLNEDRFGNQPIPANAKGDAPVDWRTVDGSHRFTWHDHRMHWMGKGLPPQIHDQSARTKVFDYHVPLRADGRRATIDGTLWWVGEQGGGFPVGAIVALVVIVILAAGFVVVVRRRRTRGPRERDAEEVW
jgi:hypothetical protein